MSTNVIIYILAMAGTTYAVRVLPLTLIKRPIENQFVQSFLYYVPYVTLAVMTCPAMIQAAHSPLAGALAMLVGILCAWFGANLFVVSGSCCAVVFVAEMLLA
jgi:Predicted membrane protein